jgi:hypothetical protein
MFHLLSGIRIYVSIYVVIVKADEITPPVADCFVYQTVLISFATPVKSAALFTVVKSQGRRKNTGEHGPKMMGDR